MQHNIFNKEKMKVKMNKIIEIGSFLSHASATYCRYISLGLMIL